MKILTVIPIAKGIPRDELSYFSAREVGLGTIVTVPFGGRKIKAIVIDENEVRNLKQSIKNESYALKNILEVHTDALPHEVFSAAQKTARFFAQPAGAVLETMVPKPLFDYYLQTPHPNPLPKGEGPRNPDIQSIQVPYHERISIYKTMIRENMARGLSSMIIAPTIVQAERIYSELKLGIDDKIHLIHGRIAKKKLDTAIKASIETKDHVVVICTAPFSSIIRGNWGSFIIESCSSDSYRYGFKPYFDMRMNVEHFARTSGSRVIYADTLLGVDIRNRITNREIVENRNTWHIAKPEHCLVVNMKPDETKDSVKVAPVESDILSYETISMVKLAIDEKTPAVLVAQRKGVAPMTTCMDCGTVVSCPNCDTPLVLHRKKPRSEERIYMCHHCRESSIPVDYCNNCRGSRFKMLGISTETISAEISKLFPNARTYLLDGDSAPTPAAAQKTIAAWQNEPGILIMTQAMTPYITHAEFGCIVSMDALLSIPSYTSSESALVDIVVFLEKISRVAIIQTRMRAHDAVQAIEREDLFDFMEREIESRKLFSYPPVKVLVNISIETAQPRSSQASHYLETLFGTYDPDIIMKKSRDPRNVIVQAILKIDEAAWNDPASPIRNIIDELPHDIKREVNPDSVI